MRKLLIGLSLLALAGCDQVQSQPTAKDLQTRRAESAANSIVFDKNAEIDNIQARLKLTTNPGQIGFVMLMNQSGSPIAYYGVHGKITSSGKRLTNPQTVRKLDCGQYCSETLGESASDEGTYGRSDPYIYFWDTDGAYHQWNGEYLYSDKPFRTRIEPLVLAEAPSK